MERNALLFCCSRIRVNIYYCGCGFLFFIVADINDVYKNCLDRCKEIKIFILFFRCHMHETHIIYMGISRYMSLLNHFNVDTYVYSDDEEIVYL